MLLRTGMAAVLACACESTPPPPPPARQPEADLAIVRANGRCDQPFAFPRSNRTEACRVVAEFEQAGPFTAWPAAGEETWFGRQWDPVPGNVEYANDDGNFVLWRFRPGSPSPQRVADYRLPPDRVLPYLVSDLPMQRWANPTSSIRGVDVERQEYGQFASVVDALAAGRPPEPAIAAILRAKTSDAPAFSTMRNGTLLRSDGPSIRLGPGEGVSGMSGCFRLARDGRRLLAVDERRTTELWKLP